MLLCCSCFLRTATSNFVFDPSRILSLYDVSRRFIRILIYLLVSEPNIWSIRLRNAVYGASLGTNLECP